MNRLRWLIVLSVLLPAITLASTSSLAQDATPAAGGAVTTIATGLTNPRGFAWGADGTLYVALAGTGGPNLPTENAPAIAAFAGYFGGLSASVVRIEDGCPVVVADGLPSYIDGTGAVVGISAVAFLDGQLYATVDGGGAVHGNPEHPAGLYRINEDGTADVVADLSAWLRANPVAEPPIADFDSEGEVFQVLPTTDGDAFWVVESNHGQVLRITPEGDVIRLADLSPRHPVPTGIALAPDGGVYVGYLTPFPFPDGTAKVVHVAPDGAVTDHWTGLTAVVALAVEPDGTLLALEMATGNLFEDPFIQPDTGRVVRQTGPDRLEVVADGLNFPIAMGFGPDGALYVGEPALGAAPGAATIARLDLGGQAADGAVTTPQCVPGAPA